METNTAAKWVPTYCFNCVAGPDLLTVKVENGVATEVAPNFRGTPAPCTWPAQIAPTRCSRRITSS